MKKVDVTLVIHTSVDVPDDWDDGAIAFYVEKSHCIGNYLDAISASEQRAAEAQGLKHGGICEVCSFAKAYVGHVEVKP